MGYVPDAEMLTLPWTRQQCLMLLGEAEDIASRRSTKLAVRGMNDGALQLISELQAEFGGDVETIAEARIESLYTTLAPLIGQPLNDSYHFGQSVTDDYGRLFDSGGNEFAGLSARARAGRWSAYFRGEYQSTSQRSAYSPSVRDFIGQLDGVSSSQVPGPYVTPHFTPLEMYAGAELGFFDVTAGKQDLWWGPGEASAFHFSNNAAPLYALRIRQSGPLLLPGPLKLLGRIRTEFVLGQLSGHYFPPDPWINAQKITFQLTEDFEVGFVRSAVFGGAGHGFTTGNFVASLLSLSAKSTIFPGADPGDRRSGFDFRWRLPKLRRYVSIYSDSLADDEPSPLANPKRSAWGPGVYVTALPGLKKMDFRFETYSTWLYREDEGGKFIYWNDEYQDAYTNNGLILGSWAGRDSRAYVASSTFWSGATNNITVGYRQTKTGGNFLPGGGTQTDISIAGAWRIRPDVLCGLSVQGERYDIPVLGAPRTNILVALNMTYNPKNWGIRR